MADILSHVVTTETVRAVLGADEVELPDSLLSDLMLKTELIADLSGWLPSGVTYKSITFDGRGAGATDDQILAYQYLILYSKYFCAWATAKTTPFTLAESINDGQSEMQRSKREKLADLLAMLKASADRYKELLLPLVGGTVTEDVAFLAKASPSYDPVTNETT